MRVVDAVQALAADTKEVPQPRLVKASHEFEAQLMKEILKPMAAEGALFSESGDADECGTLGEFAAEALGRALSEHGGLGIGNSIVRSLSHPGNPSRSEPVRKA
jgi:hypothetical protein